MGGLRITLTKHDKPSLIIIINNHSSLLTMISHNQFACQPVFFNTYYVVVNNPSLSSMINYWIIIIHDDPTVPSTQKKRAENTQHVTLSH